MEIPEQFHVRDLFNHLYVGALFLLVAGFYVWVLSGESLLRLATDSALGVVGLALVAFTIGMVYSNIGHDLCERMCFPSKLPPRLVRLVFGIRPRVERVCSHLEGGSEISEIALARVSEVFGLQLGSGAKDGYPVELFRVVKAHVDNNASPRAASEYGRQQVFYNFYARFGLVCFISVLASVAGLTVAAYPGLATLLPAGFPAAPKSPSWLVVSLLMSVGSLRIAGEKFQQSRSRHIKVIWRTFVALQSQAQKRSITGRRGRES